MREAARYYDGEASGLGNQFLDDFAKTSDRALENPESGQLVKNRLRRMLFRKFPFAIIYGVEDENIVVVAVSHQRREPGYWKDRGR